MPALIAVSAWKFAREESFPESLQIMQNIMKKKPLLRIMGWNAVSVAVAVMSVRQSVRLPR